jgi:AcrR family transcriptional regulator
VRAFATDGYKATSLRRIAKTAGCSLTLLVHHFGSKAGLLAAVVAQQQASCERRLVSLRSELATEALDFDHLAQAWADYEFAQHATREGKLYLGVMMRLQADNEVSEAIRRTLNSSEAVVSRGLQRARPSLDEVSCKELWQIASAGLYAAVVSLDQRREFSSQETMASLRGRAVAFLASGLHAYSAVAAG